MCKPTSMTTSMSTSMSSLMMTAAARRRAAAKESRSSLTDFSIATIIGTSNQSAQAHHDSPNTDRRKFRPKNFQCPSCKMAFSNNGQLKNHVRIHTGERPFRCNHDDCNKTFTRNEELTRHKLIHTGVRPHSCSNCGKKFGRKDHLKKHVKTHDRKRARKRVFVMANSARESADTTTTAIATSSTSTIDNRHLFAVSPTKQPSRPRPTTGSLPLLPNIASSPLDTLNTASLMQPPPPPLPPLPPLAMVAIQQQQQATSSQVLQQFAQDYWYNLFNLYQPHYLPTDRLSGSLFR